MTQLQVIPHTFNEVSIYQRSSDGYFHATAMCKSVGKRLNNYKRLPVTQEFISELSRSTRISADLLILTISKGLNEERGTWVHPDVAIHLAQWLSPTFAVAVSQWVREWLIEGHKPDCFPRYSYKTLDGRQCSALKKMVQDKAREMNCTTHKVYNITKRTFDGVSCWRDLNSDDFPAIVSFVSGLGLSASKPKLKPLMDSKKVLDQNLSALNDRVAKCLAAESDIHEFASRAFLSGRIDRKEQALLGGMVHHLQDIALLSEVLGNMASQKV